jgi:hypothetical protein
VARDDAPLVARLCPLVAWLRSFPGRLSPDASRWWVAARLPSSPSLTTSCPCRPCCDRPGTGERIADADASVTALDLAGRERSPPWFALAASAIARTWATSSWLAAIKVWIATSWLRVAAGRSVTAVDVPWMSGKLMAASCTAVLASGAAGGSFPLAVAVEVLATFLFGAIRMVDVEGMS